MSRPTGVGAPWRPLDPITGLLWYAGMLVPVSGLVQVGGAGAGRPLRLPLIGLFVGVVWLLADASRHGSTRYRQGGLVVAFAAAVGLGLLCYRQAGLWRAGDVLFRHSLAVCGEAAVLHNNLGNTVALTGRHTEAIEQYRAALRLAGDDARARNNLGNSLVVLGRLEEAMPELERALALTGGAPQAEANLGSAYLRTGRLQEGIRCLERASAKMPLQAVSYSELGDAYAQSGKLDAAVSSYQRALAVDSGHDVAQYRLVRTYFLQGNMAAAKAHAERLLPPASGRAQACCMLGLTLQADGLYRAALIYLRERRPYRDTPETGANGAPFGGMPE